MGGTRSGAGELLEERDGGRYPPGKRAADATLAAALLVATAPLILLILALVKLTSRGPVLSRPVRTGLGGRPFVLYKIRTMAHDPGPRTGPIRAGGADRRVTPLGRLLRRSHLDGLPQLLNVLRGEMSLVGPRPERPEFVAQIQRALPEYRGRLQVPPGIMGLAQLHLPPDTDLAGVRRKLAYDVFYIRRMGLCLDMQLVLCTALRRAGIPFGVARVLSRVPSGALIEREGATSSRGRSVELVSERLSPAADP